MDAVSSHRTELIVNESDFVCTDERRLNCPSFNLKFKCGQFNRLSSVHTKSFSFPINFSL